jgi:transcriptional regulator with XRE-family HTH domain
MRQEPTFKSWKLPPLRVLREARGLSLRQAAALADVNPTHLSMIERGLTSPTVRTLHSVALVLGLRELAATLAPYRGVARREQPCPDADE